MDKKKTNQAASHNQSQSQSHCHATSAFAQRHRISAIDENGTVYHGVALYVLREAAE